MNGHENMDSTNTWISSRTLFKTLLTVFIQNVRLTESKSTGLSFERNYIKFFREIKLKYNKTFEFLFCIQNEK